MKKLRLVESILILIMVLALLTTGIYAWIIARFASEPIIFTSGSITVDADFYSGDTEITEGGIELTNLIPGQTYSFSLIVENTGTDAGMLQISVKDILTLDSALYDLLTIEFTHPVTSVLTTIDLDASSVTLFSNYTLAYEGIFTFDFIIKVQDTLDNTLHGKSINIGYFEVRLDQIP